MECNVRLGVELNLILFRTELVEYFAINLVRKVTLFVIYHYENRTIHAASSYFPLS
jgi:hypothetical protein